MSSHPFPLFSSLFPLSKTPPLVSDPRTKSDRKYFSILHQSNALPLSLTPVFVLRSKKVTLTLVVILSGFRDTVL